jgi:dihydrofolate reductase
LKICHIVAMGRNRVIGSGLEIPWRISEDFKHFKKTTLGHAMIMGRKTWDSIGRALPGRLTVVVTRDLEAQFPDGVLKAASVEAALELCRERKNEWGDIVFIVGGGEIYKQTLPLADSIYLTIVDAEPEGDVHYPGLNKNDYEEVILGKHEGAPSCTWYLLNRKGDTHLRKGDTHL